MEQSAESDPVLIVPSSMPMSDSESIGVTPDNPLGLSVKEKSPPAGGPEFSCLQLSGKAPEFDSDSLHIDETHDDIIPSSPDAMHIDLSATPTTGSQLHQISKNQSQALENSTSEMNSGRLSPDMMISDDSHLEKSESPKLEQGRSNLGELNCTESNKHLSPQNEFKDHESKKFEESNDSVVTESHFNADTQSYSESRPRVAMGHDLTDSNSISFYLKKTTDSDSSNIFVTASTQNDTADPVVVSCPSQQKPFEMLRIPAKEVVNIDNQTKEVMEVDSNETTTKDVSVKSAEEKCSSPKAETQDFEKMESQDYSQEDLNLHLTFESQLLTDPSMANGESRELTVEGVTQTDPSKNANVSKTSFEENTTGQDILKSSFCSPSLENSGLSVQSDAVFCENSKTLLEKTVDEKTHSDDNHGPASPLDSNQNKRSEDVNTSCPKLEKTANDDRKIVREALNARSSADEELANNKDRVTTESTATDRVVPGLSDAAVIHNDACGGSEQTVQIVTKSDAEKCATVDEPKSKMSPLLKQEDKRECNIGLTAQSSSPNKTSLPSVEKEEVTPSMQSTYVNESNNSSQASSNESQNSSSFGNETNSYILPSSDDSSIEKDEDSMADLVTQPYLPTPKDSRNMERDVGLNDDRRRSNEKTVLHPYSDGSIAKGIEEIIHDIIDAVTDHGKGVKKLSSPTFKLSPTGKAVAGIESVTTVTNQPAESNESKYEFVSPSSARVRECSSGGGKRKKTRQRDRPIRQIRMEKDANNNNSVRAQNDEHEKSSDTLNNDDSSGQDSDTVPSPNKGGGEYVYRVTRSEIVETMLNGEVVDKRVLPKKIKYLKSPPFSLSSSQSSNGSGYLGDTSSLSRSSSNCSTQTHQSGSPGFRPRLCESVLHNELNGSSSSTGSSTQFVRPGFPAKTQKPCKSSDLKTSDKATSPAPESCSLTKEMSPYSPVRISTTSPLPSVSVRSTGTSPLYVARVVLNPLSTELIAMGTKACSDVATPPQSSINPPLSGSTPFESMQKSDLSSDINSNSSPEFGYPGELSQTTSIPFDDDSGKMPKEGTPLVDLGSIPGTSKMPVTEGIPVMARPPREVFFYPGIMRAQDPISGKYTVVFEDDWKERQIRENDVLLIDKLDMGQEVYVQTDSVVPTEWYSQGIILGSCKVDGENGYVIEMDSDSDSAPKKSMRFSRKRVIIKQDCLTKQQKKSFVQPLSVISSSDVSLDNIVDGKRRPRRTLTCNLTPVSSPSVSRRNSPSPSTSKTPRSLRKRRLLDPESSESSTNLPSASAMPAKRTRLSYKNLKAQVRGASTIFARCAFLLTSSTGRNHPSEVDSDASCSAYGYDREAIRLKISAASGLVVKDFNQLMSCCHKEVYIISDTYCRTMNYFNALAAGVKCVSRQWIDDSISMQTLLPNSNYLLPAGYSLQYEKVLERLGIDVKPLIGLEVCLQMKDNDLWKPMLCLAGCSIVSPTMATGDDSQLNCDIFIADGSFDAALMEKASLQNIPVITIEWAIQCLIASEKLPYDGHIQYKNFA